MRRSAGRVIALTVVFALLLAATPVNADIPSRTPISSSRSAMPLPGTQEQELGNITFPAPYNVFEFAVTCMACHSGSVDQNASHGANWAGTNMASAARDPIFRANELIVNNAAPGAGNLCFRCHSPNGWYSGRFNPKLNGDPKGGDMMHSILASTDDEGILCEACHRVAGGVSMKTVPGASFPATDTAFNLLGGGDLVYNWPHSGDPYPQGPTPGDPMGDATLQYMDGMTYGGPRGGSVEVTYSDVPNAGTPYTGQIYGVYPLGWPIAGKMLSLTRRLAMGLPQFNSIGQEYAYNPDGSIAPTFEEPADIPRNAQGQKDYNAQAISIEHPTVKVDFQASSEFCGSCHELTVPLGTGMPEQRTYTEWKYSDWGKDMSGDGTVGKTDDSLAFVGGDKRCQDCHMPKKKHEYSDTVPFALNPDPLFTGYFPYGKDRNPDGGTAFHKFAGANRFLPQMMKVLYPEVDLEVVGAPTGADTRIFPGMMSDRSTMWDRTTRNTELSLREAVSVDASIPVEVSSGVYEVKVAVTNNTGHRVPSGYPDGRRMWVYLNVIDGLGNSLFESGEYTAATATLPDSRATSTTITSANEAMIYEKVTGSDVDGDNKYVESPDLLNPVVIFDNRIPPSGFEPDAYQAAGVKFITYDGDPVTEGVVPVTDMGRFADNVDRLTYRFTAEPGMSLAAVAKMQYQSHSRPFMEMLKDKQPAVSPRPEGPPSINAANYPLTPTYLSDNPTLDFANTTDMSGVPLVDNWGGIAYAAWLKTGKGAPYTFDTARTGVVAAPAKPVLTVTNPPGNVVLGQTIGNPFALKLNWTASPGADGYEVWIRYGIDEATASWDRLGLVDGATTTFTSDSLNVGKTYGYRVAAYNSVGSTMSNPVSEVTPIDIPMTPMNLKVFGTTSRSVTLTWADIADNEIGFLIERQSVNPDGSLGQWTAVGVPTSQQCGLTTTWGSAIWTDTSASPSSVYNYRVAAYNLAGTSGFAQPIVMAVTPMDPPNAPGAMTATAVGFTGIELRWGAATGSPAGYNVYRSLSAAAVGAKIATVGGTTYTDTTINGGTLYYYRVYAYNSGGQSSGWANASAVTSNRNSTITGQITNGATPLSGVTVTLYDAVTHASVATTVTAAGGTYTIASLAPGSYHVRFSGTTPTSLAQYYNQSSLITGAAVVVLTANATTTIPSINLAAFKPPTTIDGIITANGVAQVGVGVTVYSSGGSAIKSTTTTAGGVFSLVVPSGGSYKLRATGTTPASLSQYYRRKSSLGNATTVSVNTGQTTPVTWSLTP
jgi:hypothetical protein